MRRAAPEGAALPLSSRGLASDLNVLRQAAGGTWQPVLGFTAGAALGSQNLDRDDDPGRGSRPRRETMRKLDPVMAAAVAALKCRAEAMSD